MLHALFSIQSVMVSHREVLMKSRPEHHAVERLSAIRVAVNYLGRSVTSWDNLNSSMRNHMLLMVGSMSIFCYLTTFLYDFCFEKFTLTSKIDAPFAQSGLNGNVMNVVLPLGYLVMVLFAFCCTLFYTLKIRAFNLIPENIRTDVSNSVDEVLAKMRQGVE